MNVQLKSAKTQKLPECKILVSDSKESHRKAQRLDDKTPLNNSIEIMHTQREREMERKIERESICSIVRAQK